MNKILFPMATLSKAEEQILEDETRRHVATMPWNTFIGMIDGVTNWGRKSSLWPMQFGLACCAIEMICTAASRFDIARFGAELFRPSPRQADLMIVSGTVTKKMIPMIVRIYNQMPEPKYVISMGACASGGGPFKEGYCVVSGIDKYLPVDVYVPGCPPTPQALLNGLITLQKKISGESISNARWYDKQADGEIPVPVLGPDLIDVRKNQQIQAVCAKAEGEPKATVLPKTIAAFKAEPVDAAKDTPSQKLGAKINQHIASDAASIVGNSLLIKPQHLRKTVELLKASGDLPYDYLANLTSVDYTDCFEVVYHLCSIEKQGKPLELRVRTDKTNPSVPSLTPLFPGADFQEREVWDMMGIAFEDHPDLKRILTWEGFEGYPLRKDYLEAYYEEPIKMFSSRWKEGHHKRAETRVPFGDNVRYPKGFDPISYVPRDEEAPSPASTPVGVTWEQSANNILTVNLGPQHPSTHGVFRMKAQLQGERIMSLEPIMGYMHRNHEKIGERNIYLMNFPYTDRLDYITSLSNNLAYAIAVEKLLNLKVPERAEYIRVIMAELTRIVSHFWSIGFLLNDLGAFFTPALYAIRERELILDLFEAATGSRMMCNYMRFGGVAQDLPEDFLPMAKKYVDERLPKALDELDRYITKNEIVSARCKGVGVLTSQEAIAYSAAGPVLRASGVQYDVRRAEPYSIYDRFQFDIPVLSGGDVYDRYLIRLEEIRQSLKILKQALAQIPEGPIITGAKGWMHRPPMGDAYGRAENPKGELGFYIVSDGSQQPYRYHVRAPSFINITALGKMCEGHLVADSVAILGSLDIVLGEVDR